MNQVIHKAMTQSKKKQSRPRPLVLCILDGWGHRTETENNAIAMADTPTWDRWTAESNGSLPHALIKTSGIDVGLPDGQMGNSEVGHMNIGAGRIVLQDLGRINKVIENGGLADQATLVQFIGGLKQSSGCCHLMGLVSPGGVHSHQDHMSALAKILCENGIPVRVHAFLDGRDTAPKSAYDYMAKFISSLEGLGNVSIATVSGRFYAMDRDKRWDRVEQTYTALVEGKGKKHANALNAITTSYSNDLTDEFIEPAIIGGYTGMADGDGLLMANFRSDRVRELLTALLDSDFDGFVRKKKSAFAAVLGMTEYSTSLASKMATIFSSESPKKTIGEVIANQGLAQLRIAETEKYAHVTFFFNGGIEAEFPREKRILVPSPKVTTYDLAPAMSALEVTDKLVEAILSDCFDLIVVNYANGDMVGHTGILSAAIKAAATLDVCLLRLEEAVKETGGTMLVTADHGNCECMVDPKDGGPHTSHTVGFVPLVLVNGPESIIGLENGRLSDISPTILDLMGQKKPEVMTGDSLLIETAKAPRRAFE